MSIYFMTLNRSSIKRESQVKFSAMINSTTFRDKCQLGINSSKKLRETLARFLLVYFLAKKMGEIPGKSDAAALASAIAEHSGRYNSAVLVEHVVQILLGDVGRQVGQVQISRILFLLLLTKRRRRRKRSVCGLRSKAERR